MNNDRLQQIEAFLKRHGPSSAPALTQALSISQPTLSRALAQGGSSGSGGPARPAMR